MSYVYRDFNEYALHTILLADPSDPLMECPENNPPIRVTVDEFYDMIKEKFDEEYEQRGFRNEYR